MAKKPSTPDVLPSDVLSALLTSMTPQAKPAASRLASARKRLLARVAENEASAGDSGITTFRANEREWLSHCPGVDKLLLFDDGRSRSWLTRLAAGSRLPAHVHVGDEESLVLEGSCYLGEVFLTQGDYMVARAGSRHGEVYSPEGCLLFVRSPIKEQAAAALRR